MTGVRCAWALLAVLPMLGGYHTVPTPAPAVAAARSKRTLRITYDAYTRLGDILERVRDDYISPLSTVRMVELTLRGIEAEGRPSPPGAPGIVETGLSAVRAAADDRARFAAFADAAVQLAGGRAEEYARLVRTGPREMVAGLDPHSSIMTLPRPPTQPGAVGLDVSDRAGGDALRGPGAPMPAGD